MTQSKGKELATISVYLNTGIVAILFVVGFLVATFLFAAVTLLSR